MNCRSAAVGALCERPFLLYQCDPAVREAQARQRAASRREAQARQRAASRREAQARQRAASRREAQARQRAASRIDRPYSPHHEISSEDVLQCELQDSRIIGSIDLPEYVAVEDGYRIPPPEAVRHVVGFGSSFKPLVFPDLEYSRKRHIELPDGRSFDIAGAQVAESAHSGLRERSRIQILREGFLVP